MEEETANVINDWKSLYAYHDRSGNFDLQRKHLESKNGVEGSNPQKWVEGSNLELITRVFKNLNLKPFKLLLSPCRPTSIYVIECQKMQIYIF